LPKEKIITGVEKNITELEQTKKYGTFLPILLQRAVASTGYGNQKSHREVKK